MTKVTDYDLRNNYQSLDGSPVDLRDYSTRLVEFCPQRGARPMLRLLRRLESSGDWDISEHFGTYYLAGPMRGYPQFNFPTFLMAARSLKTRGLTVLSPAEKDIEAGFDPTQPIEGQGFDLHAAFVWDFNAVIRSTGIILLPGWEKSCGAKAERLVAQLCGKRAYILTEDYKLLDAPPADYTLEWIPREVTA